MAEVTSGEAGGEALQVPELLAGVFQHLTLAELGRAARVCRLWQETATTPSLWRTLDSAALGWRDTAGAYFRAREPPPVSLVMLRGPEPLGGHGAHIRVAHLGLDLEGVGMNSNLNLLGVALAAMPNLERLTLRGIFSDGCFGPHRPGLCPSLLEAAMRALGAARNLRDLDLRGVPVAWERVSLDGIQPCPLESFSAGYVEEKDIRKAIAMNLDGVLHWLQAKTTSLKTLVLNAPFPMNLSPFDELTAANPQLDDLKIPYSLSPTFRSLPAALALSCRGMHTLNLRAVEHLTDVHLRQLCDGLPALRSLNCSCDEVTNDGLLYLARNCTHLNALDVCYCPEVTREVVPELVRLRGDMVEFGASGLGLEDEDVAAICAKWQRLRLLGIGGNPYLTEASLIQVARLLPDLEDAVMHNLEVAPEAVMAMALNLPRLRLLDVGGIPISTKHLQILAQSHPGLLVDREDGDA